MLFIFRIFFASATASNSTLSQDTEETDEEDVSETYNIDYNDKNKWAYYDCYKPKKLTVYRRKHILTICVVVGDYLRSGDTCDFETIKRSLKRHVGKPLVAEVVDILENAETKVINAVLNQWPGL